MRRAKVDFRLVCLGVFLIGLCSCVSRAEVSPELAHQLEGDFQQGNVSISGHRYCLTRRGKSYSAVVPTPDGKGMDLVVYETGSQGRSRRCSHRKRSFSRSKSRAALCWMDG